MTRRVCRWVTWDDLQALKREHPEMHIDGDPAIDGIAYAHLDGVHYGAVMRTETTEEKDRD